jgi:hypothetical protein
MSVSGIVQSEEAIDKLFIFLRQTFIPCDSVQNIFEFTPPHPAGGGNGRSPQWIGWARIDVVLESRKAVRALHHRAGLAQHGKVLGRHVRAAPDGFGQFPHRARFARA